MWPIPGSIQPVDDSPQELACARSAGVPTARLRAPDAIRGCASVIVLLVHVCQEVFGRVVSELSSPWISMSLWGQLAVYMFFVLSGDVLSYSHISFPKSSNIRKLAVTRYFRLTIPILCSCMIVFVLMKTGFVNSHSAAAVVHREDWLGAFLPFEAGLGSLFRYALVEVYYDTSWSHAYNPFLWTMSVELLGSFMTFLLLFASSSSMQRGALCLFLLPFLLLYNIGLACFLVGVLIAEVRSKGVFERAWASSKCDRLAILLIGMILVGVTALEVAGAKKYNNFKMLMVSAAVVFLLQLSRSTNRALSGQMFQWLGKISFSLYLVQFPIIISLESYLILRMSALAPLTLETICFIMFVTVACTVASAAAFLPVERATNKVCANVWKTFCSVG
jgi:peptidoglycan/LPS O-acetylase OafA/YrhL